MTAMRQVRILCDSVWDESAASHTRRPHPSCINWSAQNNGRTTRSLVHATFPSPGRPAAPDDLTSTAAMQVKNQASLLSEPGVTGSWWISSCFDLQLSASHSSAPSCAGTSGSLTTPGESLQSRTRQGFGALFVYLRMRGTMSLDPNGRPRFLGLGASSSWYGFALFQ
jgi:hypothetical protein